MENDQQAEGLSEIIAMAARRGAEIKPLGKMCGDCAFKKGTAANNDQEAVQAAADCLAFFGTFNCHTKNLEDAGRTCVGFLHAMQFVQTIEDEL